MARKSCISHKARQHIAVIRQDYYELMDRDSVSAAILSIFEYWANGAIAANPSLNNVIPVGERTVKEFEKMLLGISTDKQIRARLKAIEERGFIEASQTTGRAKQYSLDIGKLQSALDNLGQTTEPPGQTTGLPRSNNRTTPVKQPNPPVKQPDYPGQTTVSSIYTEEESISFSVDESEKESEREDSTSSHSEPSEPVTLNQSASLSSQSEALATNTGAIGDECSAPPATKKQNLDPHAQQWDTAALPWKDGDRPTPDMLQAVFDAYPKGDVFRLIDGKRNDTAIGRHLRKLENTARWNYGEASLDARLSLLDYWQAAQAIAARRVVPFELPSPQPLTPEIDANSPSQIEARRKAREFIKAACLSRSKEVG